jgi:hypothetical protein
VIVPEETTLGPLRRATERFALALEFLVVLVAVAAVSAGKGLVGRPLREVARALEPVALGGRSGVPDALLSLGLADRGAR